MTPIFGANVLAQELTTWGGSLGQYGVKAATQTVPWGDVEPARGQYTWAQLDNVLQTAQGYGLTHLGVHVVARSDWAVETPPPPAPGALYAASMPPLDSQDYYDFMFALATHLKGTVQRYSIENEVASTGNWGATSDDYFAMLATAKQAVHDADPQALVLDGAIASSLLGLAMAQEMIDNDQSAEALAFVQRFFAYLPVRGYSGGIPTFTVLSDLTDFLALTEVQQALAWMPALFTNTTNIDRVQLHYYAPWDLLPQVTDYIQSHLQAQGVSKTIELWELGYGWADLDNLDLQDQAEAVPKLLTLATVAGSDFTIFWSFSDITDIIGHPGLVTADGPRPAAAAYAETVAQLAHYSYIATLDLGSGVWGYRFDRSGGSLYVLWSETATTINLGVAASSVQVTDIQGQTHTADPAALDLDASPIFVR